jgi:hypothetical protein
MAGWTKPKHPGDAVRITMLRRGNELGDVRIQHYGRTVRVASFAPGYETCFPGDTPKMNPDNSEWFDASEQARADDQLNAYVEQAKADGWIEYDPRQAR